MDGHRVLLEIALAVQLVLLGAVAVYAANRAVVHGVPEAA
jgi:hypothetical protein